MCGDVSSAVNLSFRYSESDYVHALRSHYASRLRLRLDVVAVVVLAVLGAYFWRSPDWSWFGVACVTIGSVFALFLIGAFTFFPVLIFRREPKFRDEYTLTFSSEGIHFRTEHIDSHLQWNLYSRALVDGHSYVLYHGSNSFTVIPKRVFQSAEEQQSFEALLTQHIRQIVRRGTR